MTTTVMSQAGLATVAELAAHLRVDSIRSSTSAGPGVELLAWAGLDADHIAAAARTLHETVACVSGRDPE